MPIWFQIAIGLNVVYWAIFIFLIVRNRPGVVAIVNGVFHMLFAMLVSVAPIRAFLDSDYIGYGIGVLQFEKAAAVIPAALILSWALVSAWIIVGKGKGRWMSTVIFGDLFFAVNMGASIILDGSQNWTLQLGEYFSVGGVAGLIVLLGFFTLPFVLSAVWAANRTRRNGNPPTATSTNQDQGNRGKQARNNPNHFLCSETI